MSSIEVNRRPGTIGQSAARPDGGISRRARAALSNVIAPVHAEFDAVMAELEATLVGEVPTVDAVSRYVARMRGKGLRPAVLLLAAKATGEINAAVRNAAVGIELLQASTLLHDDVIDGSSMRRGMPSVNARWGNDIAVLMGDVLFTRALERFVMTESIPVMYVAARQTRLLIEGEILGRDLRREPDFSEKTYFELIRRKTAALMSLSVESGARLGGASEEAIERIRRYGEHLGIAFQIVDDVLDVIGDPKVIGKPTGQDLREGTVTLPLIRALATTPNGAADLVRARVVAGVRTDDEWDEVRRFIEAADGVASALATAREHARHAREALAGFPDSPAARSLDRMLDYILRRNL